MASQGAWHNEADESLASEPTVGDLTYRGVSVAELIEDFRLSCISRACDDRQLTLHKQGRSYFHIGGAGHESLLSALGRALRPGYDWFFPYYRDLCLVLSLGVSPYEVLLASVGSAEDPASGGRQMPSHWGKPELHLVSQSSPTGSQCLPAVGCAEATRYLAAHNIEGLNANDDEVTYVSLGDGATSEGEFWESLNTACRLKLPVVYLVADNGYAISVRSSDQAPGPISTLVEGFPGLSVQRFDGCDYFASRAVTAAAVAAVRSGQGPCLLHAKVTRPYSHSSSDNQARYRLASDLASERELDPIQLFESELIRAGVLDEDGAAKIRAEAHDLVADAATKALAARRPEPTTVMEHLVSSKVTQPRREHDAGAGEPVHFGEAIRRTLHEVMSLDERVRVFGEDVADAHPEVLEQLDGLGGVFGTTLGLQRAFGEDRCYNTPLAEANIVGRAVGQALRGLRPSPEIQFFDYIWTAMQQIRSELATTRWRSNGAFSTPVVLRCAIGGYVTGGAIWHSQCGESIFAHIPGLVVMFPSRARDVVGLLRAAFELEDPVLFLEHKHLYRQRYAMDPYPEPGYVISPGVAATVRQGNDLSIITWGATVQRARLAAERLDEEGIDTEIIDLRTLAPYDKQAIAASAAKTSRVLVLHEDSLTGGFGAEIAAFVGEECFSVLDAPVRRIGAKDTWVAYEPTLERAILPQVDSIVAAARELVAF